MENFNRSDFDVSYRIKLNTNTIKKCMEELNKHRIKDRDLYYSVCAYERFNKCNDKYVKEFDNTLDKIYEEYRDKQFNAADFRKLFRLSNKLTSNIYNNYTKILCSLNKSL